MENIAKSLPDIDSIKNENLEKCEISKILNNNQSLSIFNAFKTLIGEENTHKIDVYWRFNNGSIHAMNCNSVSYLMSKYAERRSFTMKNLRDVIASIIFIYCEKIILEYEKVFILDLQSSFIKKFFSKDDLPANFDQLIFEIINFYLRNIKSIQKDKFTDFNNNSYMVIKLPNNNYMIWNYKSIIKIFKN